MRDRKLFLHNRGTDRGMEYVNGITKTSLIPASKTKSGLLCFNRKMREEFPWDYASPRVIVPR